MRTVILTALIGLAASLVFNEPARSDNEPADPQEDEGMDSERIGQNPLDSQHQ